MKRITRMAVATLLSLGLLAQPALAAESKIRIVLQGAPIQFDAGADPFVESDRTLVPLRTLSEKLGFMVEWEPTAQKITLSKFPNTLVLWVGKTDAEVNGKQVTLGVAPKIVGNVTFVPVRFISEQLGANVYWNEEKQEVRVTPSGQSDPDALAFLMANVATQTPAAPQDEKMHAEVWLKITDPTSDPVEINATIDLQSQGQDLFGNIAATMPFMGLNMPVVIAKVAVRNGFIWLKVDGGLALQQLGGSTTEPKWMPLGSLSALASGKLPNLGSGTVPVTNAPAPTFDKAEFEKLAKEIMQQVAVTFGPSEVKDGKKLVRVDLDLSHVDFMAIMAKLLGNAAPADLTASALKFKIDAKMSLLVEEASRNLRSLNMEIVAMDDKTKIEMKLNLMTDLSTTTITWPVDLPSTPPAVPTSGAEPINPPPTTTGNP
jgi:hypothetical protein